MKEIKLTKGKAALVDDDDFERINQYRWQTKEGRNTFYAIASILCDGRYKTIMMHRLIMPVEFNSLIDHIDHNGLNNQKCNLRICDNRENRLNSKKHKVLTSKYKGVIARRKTINSRWRYVARITVNGKLINLGSFRNEIDAAKKYDKAAIEYFGDFANLNIKI